MTDTQRKAILGSLMRGSSRATARRAAKIDSRSFHHWLENDEVLQVYVEEGEAAAIGAVEDALYKGAMRALEDPRYFRFMAFYLERKAGWVRPTPENLHKSVQSVHSPPAPVGARYAEPAENPHKTVQSVQSLSPVGAQHATPAENPHKSVQSVQFTGDGAPATNKPANLPTFEPATLGKTVRNVQTRSSVAFMPADKTAVIPNLKAKIQETMDANRARAKS